MDSLQPPPPEFHVVQYSGPLLLFNFFHWALYGTLSVELYLYYKAFPKDRLALKCLVYGVYLVELAETIMITHDAFQMYGYGFADLEALTRMGIYWFDVPILGGLVSFIGQSFYAYRVKVLSNSRVIPVVILVISVISTVGAILTGAFCLDVGNLALLQDSRKVSVAAGVWNGASALCDVIIAVYMTYYLSRKVAGFRQTRTLISNIIRLSIETGSITALVAVSNVTLFFVFPGRTYYITPIGPIYANCVLVVLNARCQIVGGRATDEASMDFVSFSSFLRNQGPATDANAAHVVTIHREILSDGGSDDPIEMKGIGAHDASACV
ncbi:hypothetical protein FB451DRAFT_1494252 [Mycena latifolia]|nr:hypothetical protein FB451DRAFT_1494252 [Mycena latifolia]